MNLIFLNSHGRSISLALVPTGCASEIFQQRSFHSEAKRTAVTAYSYSASRIHMGFQLDQAPPSTLVNACVCGRHQSPCFLPNAGPLYRAVFAQELLVRLALLRQSAWQWEALLPNSAFYPLYRFLFIPKLSEPEEAARFFLLRACVPPGLEDYWILTPAKSQDLPPLLLATTPKTDGKSEHTQDGPSWSQLNAPGTVGKLT